MGCDIHMFVEKKESYGWQSVYRYVPDARLKDRFPRPDRDNYFALDDRWYWFFGQLAGVRRDGPPIAEPRGIPEDADFDTKEWMTDGDYHTASWLTLAELRDHPWDKRHDGTIGPDSLETITGWIKRLGELNEDPTKVRIVFAFDN